MPASWMMIFITIFLTLYIVYLFNMSTKISCEKLFQKTVKISFIMMKW